MLKNRGVRCGIRPGGKDAVSGAAGVHGSPAGSEHTGREIPPRVFPSCERTVVMELLNIVSPEWRYSARRTSSSCMSSVHWCDSFALPMEIVAGETDPYL